MNLTQKIKALTPDHILSVYSGKDGKCCCGCSGKYSYHPKHQAEQSKRNGYEVTANLNMVKRVLELLKTQEADAVDELSEDQLTFVIGGRLYMVMLAEQPEEEPPPSTMYAYELAKALMGEVGSWRDDEPVDLEGTIQQAEELVEYLKGFRS